MYSWQTSSSSPKRLLITQARRLNRLMCSCWDLMSSVIRTGLWSGLWRASRICSTNLSKGPYRARENSRRACSLECAACWAIPSAEWRAQCRRSREQWVRFSIIQSILIMFKWKTADITNIFILTCF